MTAPNGPSQQECVRGSMREAGLTANQITCSELHGIFGQQVVFFFPSPRDGFGDLENILGP